MTLTPEQVELLNAPLDPKRISQRRDKGPTLDYLETYDVIDAANRIFGYDGWEYHVVRLEQVASGTYHTTATKDNPSVEKPWALFEAEVEASVLGGPSRSDVGHGIAHPADSVDTLEMQRKGAVSDALKRALRAFGNQFGNSLYDKDHVKPGVQAAPMAQPRELEIAVGAPSAKQLETIGSLLHQVDEALAMEVCEEYGIGIQMKTDGQHYSVGIAVAGLTGGTHGTASQLIDALLPQVKRTGKGAPPPREMPIPHDVQAEEEEPAGVGETDKTEKYPTSPPDGLPHPDDIKTIGDLYNAAKDNFKMFPRDVLNALSLKSRMEIANTGAAWKILCDQRKTPARLGVDDDFPRK